VFLPIDNVKKGDLGSDFFYFGRNLTKIARLAQFYVCRRNIDVMYRVRYTASFGVFSLYVTMLYAYSLCRLK